MKPLGNFTVIVQKESRERHNGPPRREERTEPPLVVVLMFVDVLLRLLRDDLNTQEFVQAGVERVQFVLKPDMPVPAVDAGLPL